MEIFARLTDKYIRKEAALPILNVDEQLLVLFARGRSLHLKRTRLYRERAGLLRAASSLDENSSESTLDSLSKQEEEWYREMKELDKQFEEFGYDRSVVRIELTNRYLEEFPELEIED